MTYFVGLLDGAKDVWGVRIPDLPGCVGAGETPEAAISDVASALSDVVAHKRKGGFAVPKPSSVAEMLASDEMEAGDTIVMIPLVLDAGRTVRANLTLDAGLLEAIDEAAGMRGITRSAFIASAAREKIEMV
jgi:predicted RNase H-like HicB family nuclease